MTRWLDDTKRKKGRNGEGARRDEASRKKGRLKERLVGCIKGPVPTLLGWRSDVLRGVAVCIADGRFGSAKMESRNSVRPGSESPRSSIVPDSLFAAATRGGWASCEQDVQVVEGSGRAISVVTQIVYG